MARGVRIMAITAESTAGSTRLSNAALPYRASVDFAVQIHFQSTPQEKRERAIDATSSDGRRQRSRDGTSRMTRECHRVQALELTLIWDRVPARRPERIELPPSHRCPCIPKVSSRSTLSN